MANSFIRSGVFGVFLDREQIIAHENCLKVLDRWGVLDFLINFVCEVCYLFLLLQLKRRSGLDFNWLELETS